MKKKTYYLLYKITNLLNKMIYIGVHKTINKKDGYMGSGKLIQRAIKKHGIENFEKTIIKECSSQKELFELESQMVNESFIKRKDTYNLALGGKGGSGFTNIGKVIVKDVNNNCFQVSKDDKRLGKTLFNIWTNKKHSEETKRKIGKTNSLKQKGKTNSNYGNIWITNENENKLIKKNSKLPKGFRKGRVYSEESKAKLKLKLINRKWKPLSEETKAKMRLTLSKKDLTGKNNHMFGKMWINNNKENKLIKKDSEIPKGFRKGIIKINLGSSKDFN